MMKTTASFKREASPTALKSNRETDLSYAGTMGELVDPPDLGSGAARRVSSSLTSPTLAIYATLRLIKDQK